MVLPLNKELPRPMKVLPEENYLPVLGKVKEIPFNTLFAQAVLEQKARGVVLVDSLDEPESFYVVHEYGMSLLFGSLSDRFLEQQFLPYVIKVSNQQQRKEMMQIYPIDKEDKINRLFKNEPLRAFGGTEKQYSVNFHRRINFRFHNEKRRTPNKLKGLAIFPITNETFDTFGTHVVPRFFWKSFAEFETYGKGVELRENGVVKAISFSAFVTETELELGMEVCPGSRKQGYGFLITSFLIDDCIAEGAVPVWSCSFSNKASYSLAIKLGFKPVLDLPYYEIA